MGTWGIGVIENDSAMDFIYEIEDEKDLSIIFEKLISCHNKDEYIDFDIAAESLIAVEIVAALLQGESHNLTPKLNKWLSKKTKGDKNIISTMNEILKVINLTDTPLSDSQEETWITATYDQKWKCSLSFLQKMSLDVIETILKNSELMDLWKESEEYDRWVKNVEELKLRLFK